MSEQVRVAVRVAVVLVCAVAGFVTLRTDPVAAAVCFTCALLFVRALLRDGRSRTRPRVTEAG